MNLLFCRHKRCRHHPNKRPQEKTRKDIFSTAIPLLSTCNIEYILLLALLSSPHDPSVLQHPVCLQFDWKNIFSQRCSAFESSQVKDPPNSRGPCAKDFRLILKDQLVWHLHVCHAKVQWRKNSAVCRGTTMKRKQWMLLSRCNSTKAAR